MINRILLMVCVVLMAGKAISQTRLIAHKSHGGSLSAFKHFLSSEIGMPDNFGQAPERYERFSQLDSVIFVSDTVAVMVTSYQCNMRGRNGAEVSRWNPGKDTVIRHPLFSMKHDLDSIRRTLKQTYYFSNPIDSVKFIGYDNQQVIHEKNNTKKQTMPFSLVQEEPYNHTHILSLLGLILLLSLLAGLFSWKFIKN